MKHFCISLILLYSLLCTACAPRAVEPETPFIPQNAVYYWKTTFNLSGGEMKFLRKHDIKKIYLRMFDVTENPVPINVYEGTVPNASVTIAQDYIRGKLLLYYPDIEIIPVVYITLDALKAMRNIEYILADNLVERVRRMCSFHEFPNVKELQIDCDWTLSTEESFFRLCESINNAIYERNLGWALSSTIRLHQLRRPVPPVTRGVLMIYNTGSFNNPDAENSIISKDDVEPYMAFLPRYSLPLDMAYPTYSWQLLFRERRFIGLLRDVCVSDTSAFSAGRGNTHIAKHDIISGNIIIRKGDMVRTEASGISNITEVKQLIDNALGTRAHNNILYHLDSNNLSKYSDDEIKYLYSAPAADI